jgi:3-phosphoshikimate 1-carboxyvinyltransferase
MEFEISKSRLHGRVRVPGSKSHTIRSFVFGLLSEGGCEIREPLLSADTRSCLDGIEKLGARVERASRVIPIRGTGGLPSPAAETLDVGNSGTTLRLLAGAAALGDSPVAFVGDASIRTRPMKPLLGSLRDLGADVQCGPEGKCPFRIRGPLSGGQTRISGITSQYLSSLLIALPLAQGDSTVFVENLHEKPYVDMTLDWLSSLDIVTEHENHERFRVRGRQRVPAFTRTIPADFSTACFPLCAAAVTGSEIVVEGLDFTDIQGDKAVFAHFEKMGMKILTLSNGVRLVPPPGGLRGARIDCNPTPDALPVLAVAACFARDVTEIANVSQARIKECDRIAAMSRELRKMGAHVEEREDGMVVHPAALHAASLDGCSDHRIVMALTIAGMACEGETRVSTAESAAVTYPDFLSDMQALGARVRPV